MAYSTIAQLRANIKGATTTNIDDATVTDRIANADDEIEAALSSVIDFTLIVTTPVFLNMLSQWKTCELCLAYLHGAKREAMTVSDVDYWMKKYNDLIAKILNGEIPLEDAGGISISSGAGGYTNPKDGIIPGLGMGEYGEHISNDDLKDDEERSED